MVDYSPAIMATTKVEVFNHLRLGGAIAEEDARVQAEVLMGWAESSYSDRAAGIATTLISLGVDESVVEFLSELVAAIGAQRRALSP